MGDFKREKGDFHSERTIIQELRIPEIFEDIVCMSLQIYILGFRSICLKQVFKPFVNFFWSSQCLMLLYGICIDKKQKSLANRTVTRLWRWNCGDGENRTRVQSAYNVDTTCVVVLCHSLLSSPTDRQTIARSRKSNVQACSRTCTSLCLSFTPTITRTDTR